MQRNALIKILKSFFNSLPLQEKEIFQALKQLIQSLHTAQDEKTIFQSADSLRKLLKNRPDFFDLKILLARHWSLNERDERTQKPIDILSRDPLDINNERDVIPLSNGRVYGKDSLLNYFQNLCGYNRDHQPQDDYHVPLTGQDKEYLKSKGIRFLTSRQIRNKREQENLEHFGEFMREENPQFALPLEEKEWIEESLLAYDRLWAQNPVRRNISNHSPVTPVNSARTTGALIGRIAGSVVGLGVCYCIGAFSPAFLPVTWMVLAGTSLTAGGYTLWRSGQPSWPPAHLERLSHFTQGVILTFGAEIIGTSLLSFLAGGMVSLLASLSAIPLTAAMTATSILMVAQPCIPLALFAGAAIAEIFHQDAFPKTMRFITGLPAASVSWLFEKIGTGIGTCIDACHRHFQRNQTPAPQPSYNNIPNSDAEIRRAFDFNPPLFSPAFVPISAVNRGVFHGASPFPPARISLRNPLWNASPSGNRAPENAFDAGFAPRSP